MIAKRIVLWVIVLFLLAALPVMTAVMAQEQEPAAKQLPVVMVPGEFAAPETFNLYESEANNSKGTADPIGLRDVMGGKINNAGDVDYYSFHVDDEWHLLIDIEAASIGSNLDAVVCLHNDWQSEPMACNDNTDTVDSLLYFTLYFGDYFVSVEDYGNAHGGNDHFYELILSNPLLVSATTRGSVAGISFQAADILAHSDLNNGVEKWVLFFDASDVGISKNLWNLSAAADWPNQDDDILIGFAANQSLPGLGTVTPYDVIRFDPVKYGPETLGEFTWFLRGNNHQLTTTSEKIDSLGGWIGGAFGWSWCYGFPISTVGAASVPSSDASIVIKQRDEDIFCKQYYFDGSGFGPWVKFFDGSEVTGLSGEDVIASAYDEARDEMYLTLLGTGNISGHPLNQKAIFTVNFGLQIYEFIRVEWRGPDHGWNYNIDAFDYTGW